MADHRYAHPTVIALTPSGRGVLVWRGHVPGERRASVEAPAGVWRMMATVSEH